MAAEEVNQSADTDQRGPGEDSGPLVGGYGVVLKG